MKAIITGANGQLGWELQRVAPPGWQVFPFDRLALDISERSKVIQVVEDIKPDVIINAAAYTAVDKAESEPARAMSINGDGPANLATAIQKHGGRLLHISTDFVFDGRQIKPYLPEDPTPNPLGVYGTSKLKGEKNIMRLAASQAVIIRTAWLYSSHGYNFVKTMLRLMGEKKELSIVSDQIGCPTWARELARVLWLMAGNLQISGVFHWTDGGQASWYDFATAILEKSLAMGILKSRVLLKPILTEQYPTPAQRPTYSVLDTTSTSRAVGCSPLPWQDNLELMLQELKKSAGSASRH